MVHQSWENYSRNNIVCVDSYEDGILKGRIYGPCRETQFFDSLSQFLLKMETMLDDRNMPQSYTRPRTFSERLPAEEEPYPAHRIRKGEKATFELQVHYRQHTSWQGMLRWLGENAEQSFRSVLELILLMDSALRCQESQLP